MNFSTTARYRQPILWGGYGMNLSAGLPEVTQRTIVYLDYQDWSAVTEKALHVAPPDNDSRFSTMGGWRVDDPAKLAGWRHGERINGGFMDGHVERLTLEHLQHDRSNQLAASIWHPARRVGWTPVFE